jgi:hypothetical protein
VLAWLSWLAEQGEILALAQRFPLVQNDRVRSTAALGWYGVATIREGDLRSVGKFVSFLSAGFHETP